MSYSLIRGRTRTPSARVSLIRLTSLLAIFWLGIRSRSRWGVQALNHFGGSLQTLRLSSLPRVSYVRGIFAEDHSLIPGRDMPHERNAAFSGFKAATMAMRLETVANIILNVNLERCSDKIDT